MKMMSIEQIIELEDERDRESFFEDYIAKQTNLNYLKVFRKEIMKRKNITKPEKLYYCGLIFDRLNELKKS